VNSVPNGNVAFHITKMRNEVFFDASMLQFGSKMPCGTRPVHIVDSSMFAYEGMDHFDVYTQIDVSLKADRRLIPKVTR